MRTLVEENGKSIPDARAEIDRTIENVQVACGMPILQNGYYARRFKMETQAGMIGVNVGIPAPVASLPFGGMKASQFSHIKAQGKAIVSFFTQEKIVTERYWPEG